MSTLNNELERVNNQIAYNTIINSPEISADIDKHTSLKKKLALLKEGNYTKEDTLLFNSLRIKIDLYNIDSLANNEFESMEKYVYPEAHREVYKTIGSPHLDQNYTVFGEVVKGINIVDSIAAVKTNGRGKPVNDVRIIYVRMIKRQSY
jgi:cyclophilin family peptidyl-prolyl cis-trans isomerase